MKTMWGFRFALSVVLSVSIAWPLAAGDNKWTGSSPYGGVARGFTFHPTDARIVFTNTDRGLFRSMNGGRTWQRIELPGGAVAIGIHPKEPSKVIAARWQVFASNDSGDTWQEISSPSWVEPGDGFTDIQFDPADPKVIYGVANSTGVYKCTDAGRTWVKKNRGLTLTGADPMSAKPQLLVNPTDGDTAYVSLANRTLYKTTDGAEHWRAIDKGLTVATDRVFRFAMDPGDPETLYAACGEDGVFRTTSGGDSWGLLEEAPDTRGIAIGRSNPPSASVVFTTSAMSSDNGATWQWFDPPGSGYEAVGINPGRPKHVFLGGWERAIVRSLNSGTTWEEVGTGLDDNNIYQVFAFPDPGGEIWAKSGRLLYESRNGGRSWTLSTLSSGDEAPYLQQVAVHPRNPDYVVAVASCIAISTDRGRTWVQRNPYQAGQAVALDPRNQRIIYLAPSGAGPNYTPLGIAKSTDKGVTWELINRGIADKSIQAIAVSPNNSSNVLAGTWTGKIYGSVDGGSTWQLYAADLVNVWSLDFDGREPNVVYAATHGAGTCKSTDGGRTWKQLGVYWRVLAPAGSDPGTLFNCGFGGLSISTDGGEEWSGFDSTGLGPFWTYDVVIDPANRNRFFIATDRGVFSYTRRAAGGAPLIQLLSPAAGKAGDAVTISGSRFGQLQSDSKVLFGSIDAGLAQSWSDTVFTVTVPMGVRTGYVTATVLGQKSNPYEFVALPASGKLEPTSGPSTGGTRVTIIAPSGATGTQFNVLFGVNVARNVRFTQPNIITCDSPPGTGTVDVKVTTILTSTTVGTFTYE